ncbi:MAG: putative spermidine/putrescine transport system substrate-binding protein [Phormidesmis priestleyi Ana]|uniref:Putative spermidine/putrescine transport system substrate-binding protein n=1 Tax=Phormidesmis priestleyi Ana TaxID=1666911 RepID=A0A0P8BY61_9CYAN|nr:MAG: putative spermidine/putrescine transport system substrate-binding protein [Phormidesmis priestleyi Ana]
MAFSRRYFLILSAGTTVGAIAASCAPQQSSTLRFDPTATPWEEVTNLARGTTVNWAMWGGSDQINGYADGWVAERLQTEYGVTLNRVPLNDTVEAVNKVVGEVQAGVTENGSIDLIWINGENFRTMKQGDLLFGPFTDKLPAMAYYDTNNAAILSDFGLPIDGYEAPYTGAFYIMAANSAKTQATPQNFEELLTWAKANPGRFTYVAPPQFDGSRFLLTALYGLTGGYEQYSGAEFDADLWAQKSPQVFEYLAELEPYLWQAGSTYPPSQSRLQSLFSNGEIWLMPAFTAGIAEGIATGQFPETTQAYAMPGISLNDPSFTAIPINASNPAGAMVLSNILSSPEGQLQKFDPAVWGDPPLLTRSKLSDPLQKAFDEIEAKYGMPLQDIAQNTVPVVNAEYTTRLEQAWAEQIAI